MDYYQHTRREIRSLLPASLNKILEVGAGAGATLHWLKSIYPNAETTAVEINSALEDELKQNVDVAIIGGIQESISQLKAYDLILLLDVLEHIANPAEVLIEISKLLEPHGHIIVSVPNIAHLSVSVPLLFRRRFIYQDSGILDRTHLRFFVEDTAIKLLNDAGFIILKGLTTGLQGPKASLLNLLSLGTLRHHLTKQYIMLGQVNAGRWAQKKIFWMAAK